MIWNERRHGPLCGAESGDAETGPGRPAPRLVPGPGDRRGTGVLRIVANGMELDEEDLWVDPRLLAGYEPPVQVKVILEAPAEEENCEVT